jgi:hypothetical protein
MTLDIPPESESWLAVLGMEESPWHQDSLLEKVIIMEISLFLLSSSLRLAKNSFNVDSLLQDHGLKAVVSDCPLHRR